MQASLHDVRPTCKSCYKIDAHVTLMPVYRSQPADATSRSAAS
jgi:hypothetical protein